MSSAPQPANQAAPQQPRANLQESTSFGYKVTKFATDVPPVLGQKRGLALLFLMLMYAGIHYYIDYSVFGFQNNFLRTVMHAAFATIAINVLAAGRNAGMRWGLQKGTVIAIWKVFIYAFFFSIGVYTIAPTWLVTNGGAEIILGIILFISVGAFPKIYVKDQNFDPSILRVFIFTAYLLPFIAQGVFLQFFSSGVLSSTVPQLQHILINYLTPMFLPIWLYYLAFFQDYIEKPFWFVILLVALILLFSSPLWIDYYNGGISALGSSGVNDAQKSAATKYLTDVGVSAYTFYQERWNATATSAKCWWYDMSGQLDSLTGQKRDDAKYAICNPQTGGEVSEFEASVERGALSAASMTLGTITAAQQQYYQAQPATFLAPFKAQSFDTVVRVTPQCSFALISNTNSPNPVTPTTNAFTVEGSAQQDIICTIPAGRLSPGKSYQFASKVTFDYVTSAYITRYFTTAQALNSFRSGSMSAADNLLSFYSISDKQPISRSTKGPTKVGLNAGSGLIVVGDSANPNAQEFTVVVTVENQKSWAGKMEEVRLILLALPKGVELKERSTVVEEPKPPAAGPVKPVPSWSNYDCTSGAFVGNFEKLPTDVCESGSIVDSDLNAFTDLDCGHYNYYYLRPGYGTSKTAIAVNDGLESTQKPFVSCQAVASDASELFARNANFATKSIQARVKYTYQLQQTKSFKVEPLAPGEKPYVADDVLAQSMLCDTANSYSLDPNLAYAFYYKKELNAKHEKFISFTDVRSKLISDNKVTTALSSQTCPIQTIAISAIVEDWQNVQGNPMTQGSTYGYLRAKKDMITYLQSRNLNRGASEAAYIVPGPTDATYTDSAQLDSYLRENNLLVATQYINALTTDPDCKSATTAGVDYSCVVGKLKCGVGYKPLTYSSCSVGDCEYCEKQTATNVLTLATQIAQYSKTPFVASTSNEVASN